MGNIATVHPVGAPATTQFLPVLFLAPQLSASNPSVSQTQPQSISSVNLDPSQSQPPVNISINLSPQETYNAAALQAAYISGLSEKTSRHYQRQSDSKHFSSDFFKMLFTSAAVIGGLVGGLLLLSRSGRHAIKENRQALFNEHLPQLNCEQTNTIAFQDFLNVHKGGLESSLSNGQLRTALIEMSQLEGKSEYHHAVLSGNSIYVHNDPSTSERSFFVLQKGKNGNIVLEKKPLESHSDLLTARMHSHPMNVSKVGKLNFSSPLHSIFEGIKGAFIQALGGDFTPTKSSVDPTHFSDRPPSSYINNNNSDGLLSNLLALDIGMNLANSFNAQAS